MFEKVNPGHPDKMADRLAGAVVDLVYERAGGLTKANPRVACEVMAGHGRVDVQIETSLGRMDLRAEDIDPLIRRLFGERVEGNVLIAPQDAHLSDNQTRGLRCGDNGIFKGCPPTYEQKLLTAFAESLYERWPYDGKYIIDNAHFTVDGTRDDGKHGWVSCDLTICQSHATEDEIRKHLDMLKPKYFKECPDVDFNFHFPKLHINPLGPWTGGIDVDCGCTNRKLGSDMGDGVTGGGLMGKDLSKADVSVNIVCYLKAVASGQVVTACCSIGDESVTFVYADGRRETETFADIVEMARLYIMVDCGGSFETFAMWGLLRP
ncbi:MAG: hypothetical protein IKD75_10535 [Prevotella sp.]|nr:hypothetical protein [Prevotella sp.]